MNSELLKLTAGMPMKQINLDEIKASEGNTKPLAFNMANSCTPKIETPYLQRYYAGTFRDGVDLWLHRFLSSDGDRHLHSHPFEFNSVILSGGYKEEFLCEAGHKVIRNHIVQGFIDQHIANFLHDIKDAPQSAPLSFAFLAAAHKFSTVGVFDWHRIAEVQHETWSAVLVKKQRLPKWFFKSDDGDLVDMMASPRDWWKNYDVRPESGIAINDNRKATK